MDFKKTLAVLALIAGLALPSAPVDARTSGQSTTPPAGTATPAATAAPTRTPAGTPAGTPTVTRTPAGSPAPIPTSALSAKEAGELLAEASWLQLIGNCDQARRILVRITRPGNVPELAAEANYRLAQCYLHDAATAEAMDTLKHLLATAPRNDPHRAPAQFLLGESLSALGAWKDAEAAYQAHLPLAPELHYLTWQRIAAQRQALGDPKGAAEAFRQALAKSPDWTNTLAIRRALADLALAAGNAKEAVAQYDALRGNNTTGSFAAEMQYLSGNALARATNLIRATGVLTPTYPAEALKRWQAAIDADNTSRYAHSSIVALLDADAPVDEYQRGVANHANGVHALAVAAFDRLLAAEPDGRQGLAYYYRGLSKLALDQLTGGLADLDRFIDRYPASPQWADASMAKGRALARAGRTSEAVSAYRELAKQQPASPQAVKALWQAAALVATDPPDTATAEAYLDVARRYPAADEGWRSYQAAGMAYFRLAEWRRAAAVWGEMATAKDIPAFARPVGYYWQGRALRAAGDTAGAKKAWSEAVALGETFFGLRAAAWLDGSEDAWVREGAPKEETPLLKGSQYERAEIGAWLREWAGTGTLNLPPAVLSDADWVRGQALLQIGRRTEALTNWERVRKRYEKNPWVLAGLSLAFRDAGANRLSLLSAEGVIGLRGQPLRETPVALQRLAYPMPYERLIRQEAARQKVDPRLLAAIIRQESRFEPGVASSAGAQGLMQVMPGTAAGIARQMAWPGYEDRQAYWPYVNVAFGAYYVRQWMSHFDGSAFAALAAYNGGPGNAGKWWLLAPDDDDLFAGLININETRVYVQIVWQNYEFYRRLYAR